MLGPRDAIGCSLAPVLAGKIELSVIYYGLEENCLDRIKFQFLRGESSAPFGDFAGLLRGCGAALWASVTQHLYVICNVSKLILQSARSRPLESRAFDVDLSSLE